MAVNSHPLNSRIGRQLQLMRKCLCAKTLYNHTVHGRKAICGCVTLMSDRWGSHWDPLQDRARKTSPN